MQDMKIWNEIHTIFFSLLAEKLDQPSVNVISYTSNMYQLSASVDPECMCVCSLVTSLVV